MFRKISVLVPTRHRVQRLHRLLESFARTTVRPDTAELVFRIDDDDQDSAALLADFPYPVLGGPRLQGYRSLPLFFEEMRAKATGDLFITGNDDIVFQTPDWSTLLIAEANKYPDGIFALGVETHNAGHFPFPVISRKAVDCMGRIHHPELFWGDVYLRDVFAAFGRAIRVHTVTIDHEWIGHAPDPVFREAHQEEARNWDPAYWRRHRKAVDEAVGILRAGMRQAVTA